MAKLDGPGVVRLARASVRGWVDDAAPSMGAALAFYTLLSLAPLLLVALGVAGIFFDRNEAQDALIGQLAMLVGEKPALAVEAMLQAAGTREDGVLPAIIGTVTMILGATTVFGELRSDLDRIWAYKAPEKGGLMRAVSSRFFSFLLVMSIGLLLILSMMASTVLASFGTEWFGRAIVPHVLEFFTSFVVITVLFAMIYKLLPSQRIAWSDVWIGAAVTSVLFWIGKLLIALYIARAAVDSTFGAAGAVVVLILWVYYSAQVFFLGAEFTKHYALRHGSRKDLGAVTLTGMNAPYEALLARARRITKRRDPIFGK